MNNARGVTLIEVMIVIAIIAFLAVFAIPEYLKFVARSKRAEAQVNLAALYAAEKVNWSDQSTYTSVLQGIGGLGWKPEGKIHYTYGFAGAEGTNYVRGKLEADIGALGQAHADKNTFVAIAVADIDGDGVSDVLAINEKRELVILQDDLT
jgi:prepilin-type N-terminal cleavage/methylation domain-containing protein